MARLSLAALFVGAILISFAPIFVRLSEIGPTPTAFYRLALAMPFLWMWLTWERRGPPGMERPRGFRDYGLLFLCGLFFACDLGFWHWSITYTTVANATLLANTAPVFVVLGGWLIFRRRFGRLFLFGMTLGLVGTIVLMGTSMSLSPRHLLGDGLGLVTGAFYGSYMLTVERLRQRFSTATIMGYVVPVSAAAMLLTSLATGETLVALTWEGWAVLFGLAVLSQLCGQSLIAYGMAHLPAAFTSVSLLLQPLAAALFAWILFAEAIGPLQGAGGVIILAGIWLARRGSLPTRSSVSHEAA